MSQAPRTRESEHHPNDLFAVAALEVHCPVCKKYLRRSRREDLRRAGFSAYSYSCPDPGCRGSVTLLVPRSIEAKRGVPSNLALKETELEPDDTFSIAQLDVLCRKGDLPCTRTEKKRVGEHTSYSYVCPDCGESTLVDVPLGLFGHGP